MTLRYKNNVACTLAASMTDSAVTIALTPGDGAQLPVIASGTDDTFLITVTDKNGNKEIISICRRDSGSDTLYVGTGLTHQATGSTEGRAQEGTTAIAVTFTDDHAISMCPTAGPFEAAVKYSDAGELTVSTEILNYLSTAGITLEDLQKLHAITALAANINKDCTGATVQNTRTITAGTGLSGGGTLAANRTISHASHTGDVTGAAELTIGAKKVLASMLNDGTNERNWVMARYAGAAFGAVGTYVLGRVGGGLDMTAGGTTSGANIAASYIWASDVGQNSRTVADETIPGLLTGTWRNMGPAWSISGTAIVVSLWLRIA
jgi:hypothetical protein